LTGSGDQERGQFALELVGIAWVVEMDLGQRVAKQGRLNEATHLRKAVDDVLGKESDHDSLRLQASANSLDGHASVGSGHGRAVADVPGST
jgi:hypothetical protein